MALRLAIFGCVMGCLFACSKEDSSDDDSGAGSGSAGMSAGQAGSSSSGTGGAGAGAAGMSAAGSGNAGNAGNAGAAGSEDPIERMPLPGESRIHEHTLNLVDADAEAQLIAFLLDGTLDLELPAQRFYEVFPDEYDFLFFVTDRPIDGAASGTHKSVRETPIVGTGITGHETFFEYYSHEKLRSVLAINRSPGAFPPFGHEIMHDFANFLDESFGFGHDGELDIGPHWGLTSVFGQLGGFDASTLRCETPAGAMPPDCTPLESGRTRYVVGSFGPHTNSFQSTVYAPLELYLMGLIPLSEVPETFTVMVDGATDFESFTDADGTDTLIVEASSLGEIAMADIVAVHGERPLATEDEKHFTSAFVVVSSSPASEEVMAEVNEWSEIFGNHQAHQNWQSFETLTGGRATLETRIGPTRAVDDPLVPPMNEPPSLTACDLLLQDCEPGLGCYVEVYDVMASCHSSGTAAAGEPCMRHSDCAPGNACSFGADVSLCSPFCDAENTSSDNACATLCPGGEVFLTDNDGVEIYGAFCLAGAGGACDPLAPECEPGKSCYGHETPGCMNEGSVAQGDACSGLPSDCVPGTTCVGLVGGEGPRCQPYCDLSNAAATNACETLCPGRFWTFDTFGLCMPDA